MTFRVRLRAAWLSLVLACAALPAFGQVTWDYQFQPNGQALATYKGDVKVNGNFCFQCGAINPNPQLNVYAATTGIDQGTCQLITAPCRTINYALSQGLSYDVAGGDLNVNIGAGTFSENVIVNGYLRGAINNAGFINTNSMPLVNFVGAGSASTTIAGGQVINSQSFCYAVASNEYAEISLTGMTITANAGGSSCAQSDIYAQFFGSIFIISDVKLGASNGIAAFAEEYGAIIVTPGSATPGLTFAASTTGAIGLSDNSSFQSDSTISFTGSPAYSGQMANIEGNSTLKLAGNPATTGTFTGRLAAVDSNATFFTYFAETWPGTISVCTGGGSMRLTGLSGSPACNFAVPKTVPGGAGAFAPTGTASTAAYVMMGMAAGATPSVFTPIKTGAVDVSFSGSLANSVAGDGAQTTLLFQTGAAPANGGVLAGSFCGAANPKATSGLANAFVPFTVRCTITGLTLGTQVWFDLGLAAITGGTATISNVTFTAVELPQG